MEVNTKYNWDDFDVGNLSLDHSENFFAQKHFNHEKLSVEDEFDLATGMANTSISNKENLDEDRIEETNCIKAEHSVASVRDEVHEVKEENISLKDEVLEIKEDENKSQNEVQTAGMDTTTVNNLKAVPNLATQWSTQKKLIRAPLCAANKGEFVKPAPPTPNAFKYHQIYQRKKEEALRKKQEEDRKLRQFHPRPLPDFNTYNKDTRPVVHAITVPVTPKVVKHSKLYQEKRKQKLEEILQKQEPPRFHHRSPKVLAEPPFQPKKVHHVIEPKPFNLHTEERLQERKEYNKVVKQTWEEKKKKEEEERKKREEEQRKELRKAACFKARPNPFK